MQLSLLLLFVLASWQLVSVGGTKARTRVNIKINEDSGHHSYAQAGNTAASTNHHARPNHNGPPSPASSSSSTSGPAAVSGPAAIQALAGRCFVSIDSKYGYTFCPFHNITQLPASSTWAGNRKIIGKWGQWKDPSQNQFTHMLYQNGDHCASTGTGRSSLIMLQCGITHSLSSFSEAAPCFYVASFAAPEVCEAQHAASSTATSTEEQPASMAPLALPSNPEGTLVDVHSLTVRDSQVRLIVSALDKCALAAGSTDADRAEAVPRAHLLDCTQTLRSLSRAFAHVVPKPLPPVEPIEGIVEKDKTTLTVAPSTAPVSTNAPAQANEQDEDEQTQPSSAPTAAPTSSAESSNASESEDIATSAPPAPVSTSAPAQGNQSEADEEQ